MVTIIKLYILFIAINFGWGMLATGIVEASLSQPIQDPIDESYINGQCDGFGEPVCQFPQGCPADGVPFDNNIHHKLCEVGIQTPTQLNFDADPQSPDDTSQGGVLLTRNVTNDRTGTIYEVLVDGGGSNGTGVASSGGNAITGDFGSDFFSFIDDTQRIAGFGAKIFLDTFTGGFILDVLGTGIVGVDFPTEFLDGIKILIGLAIVSYFGYLFIGKPLLE